MEKSFGSGGAMFVREKKSQNAADYGGDVTLEGDVLDYIVRKAANGEEVKVEIGGWKRQGRNGSFLSLKVQLPYAERQSGQAPRQGFQTTRGTFPPREQQPQRNEYAERSGRSMRNAKEPDDDFPASMDDGRGQTRTFKKDPWE